MKTPEFVLAFNEFMEEKQLPTDTVISALESAMVSAYRKAVTASAAQHVEAKLDSKTGKFEIYAEKEVVEEVVDSRTEVLLSDARKVDPMAEVGDMVSVESTPDDFGRVAAQTARQVIQQRIRDAERGDQVTHFQKQVGEIITGVVQAINTESYTIGLDKKAEGTLQKKSVIRGERFRLHDRIRALVVEVKDTQRSAQIMLSRTEPDFLRRLLENEIPEIYHGIVEIRSISREPGERAKIAVSAMQPGIDPVGACVGQRGNRIQSIVRELHDEKIDVIEWNPDPRVFIAKALSPARVIGVYLCGENHATVIVPEDQLSLAIGRDGQNARLAARLTSCRIDIKSVSEAASELIHQFEQGEDVEIVHSNYGDSVTVPCGDLFKGVEEQLDEIRAILAKKIDKHEVTSDEANTLNHFVDEIENRKASYVRPLSVAETIKAFTTKDASFEEVCDCKLKDCGLQKHVCEILAENGYKTFADIFEVMNTNPDALFRMRGVTAKDINDLTKISSYVGSLKNRQEPVAEVEEAVSEDGNSSETAEETLPEVVVEEVPAVETVPEETREEEPEPVEEVPFIDVPESDLENRPMDEWFNSIHTDMIKDEDYDDEDGQESYDKPSKKKKKKKGVQMEYDPDSDSMMVRRKHKRGDDDWGW